MKRPREIALPDFRQRRLAALIRRPTVDPTPTDTRPSWMNRTTLEAMNRQAQHIRGVRRLHARPAYFLERRLQP